MLKTYLTFYFISFTSAGYLYNFPFLHESCNIVVEDNCVEPLYKHLVNIHHPSMCFIGVPYYVCAFSMFDLQVCTPQCFRSLI